MATTEGELTPGEKLELARGALEIGERDYARKMLAEVEQSGDEERKKAARALFEEYQLGRPDAEIPQRPEASAGGPQVAPAVLKERILFGGAGELYSTTILAIGALLGLALLAQVVPPALVAVTGVIGLVVFAMRLYKKAKRGAERRRWILERGIVTEGNVTDLEDERRYMGGAWKMSLGWTISYSYRDDRGNAHWGRSGRVDRREAQRYKRGDRCYVVFDPEEPDSSFWVSR